VVRSLDDALPLRISTGLGSRPAPRIELYLNKPRDPSSAGSASEK
jgi:hypothetical protein